MKTKFTKLNMAVAAALVLVLVSALTALALTDLDPTTTWNVTPILKTFPDDRACPAGSTLVQDIFQSVTQEPEGTYTYPGPLDDPLVIDGVSVTIEITTYADNSFDFNIINGVTRQMFVKGDNYLLYQYDPKVSGATNTGPVSYDTGLHDGANPKNENEYKDVSHLDFCLTPIYPLRAEKTAAGTYDRTVTWTLDKSVDDDSHTGYAGQIAGTSNWTVVADKTEAFGNYQVTGSITVYNDNAFAVPVTISDVLDDGTVAIVTCPSYTVPAYGSLTCSYTALPDDASAILNTATITSNSTEFTVGGAVATAGVSFTEKLIGYDSGTLSDDNEYNPYPPTLISGDTTWTYGQTFTCSSDPAMYGTNGMYSFNVPNTATLNGNINQSDTENVTVTCYLQPLVPTKDAAGTYDRTVTWTLDKSVDDDSHTGFAGQVAGTSNWKVVAVKTEVSNNYVVKGNISISNPAAIDQTFTISDVLDDGTVATVTCPSNTVPAGGKVDCTYTASSTYVGLVSGAPDLNTVTVSAVGNPDQTATANVTYTEKLIGYDSGTLSDDNEYNPYPPTMISGDTTWTYGQTFTCSSDPALYSTNGVYSFNVPNTATLNDNINQSDTENVTVTCYAPVITKDAYGTYDERHIWDVDKTVDPALQGGFPGSVLPWTWIVKVSETFVEENFKVAGKIYVANPAGSPGDMTVSLVDQLNDGTAATVDCGGGATSLTVAPGATGTCDYTAIPGGRTATENKATGTFNSIDFYATYPVSFVKNVVNGTATVTDTEIGLNEELTAGSGPWEYTKNYSHTCSSNRADYFVDGVYTQGKWTITNWAYVYSNDELQDKDDATTTYTCDAGFVDVLKLTDGVVNATKDWQFALYEGPDGFGGTQVGSTSSTLGDADGVLEFGSPALNPEKTYTVCELGVPAGWTSFWQVDVNGDGIFDATVNPYNPNADDVPSEDLGNRCVDFGAGTTIPITVGTTIHFQVDNTFPGGAPRTPGYWKNWNRCTGGGQQYTADTNGGWEEGYWLLEDVLDPNIGGGIVWDDILSDSFVFPINTCDLAVSILDQRDFSNGKKMASDAGYNLAMHLLAAQLNFGAGACTTQEVLDKALAAETLLDKADFDAVGRTSFSKADASTALQLANYLDQYNNGAFCGNGND